MSFVDSINQLCARLVDTVNYNGLTMCPPPDHPADVLDQFHTLMFTLKHRMRDAVSCPEADGRRLAPTEARLLQHVARHPGATQGDLVEHTGRDKAQINRLVQQSEEAGWLQRVPDDTDRRKLRLELTAAGRAVVKGLVAERRRLSARLVADFSTDDLTRLADLLSRMQANLQR